ncbi:TPA: glycosyltransferase family 4 protein [Legionella anisa]
MSKLKICYILSTTEGGTWAFEQLRELRDKYHFEVSVVLSGQTGTLVERFNAESIPVYDADFGFMNPKDILYLPGKIIKLVRFLRQMRFDVIQTHLFPSMVIGRIAGWLADVPLRFSMIAGPFHLEAETPKWVDKITAWMDTAIIPSCEFTRQLYLNMGISEKRLHVIYYGPDEKRFDVAKIFPSNLRQEYNWEKDTPLIGMVAYFYPKLGSNRWTPPFLHEKAIKGHKDLIHAAQIVLKKFPQAKFLLIGKGWGEMGEEEMRSMKSLVEQLGLQKSVIFTGHRTDIPGIYRELDISIQASLNENLGGTIEALLMECPTVVTRVGGLVDTVIDGKTGIQVNVADPNDLAKGILYLLQDPTKARLLGMAGRTLMLERFTLSTTVRNLNNLYNHYLDGHNKGYKLIKSCMRFFLIGIMGFFISLRFFLLDMWLLPRLDVGWRPWRGIIIALKMRLYRIYALIGRLSAKSWIPHPKMLLYRAYALIGRLSKKITPGPWKK